MKKKFTKMLEKHFATVVFTMIFCAFGMGYYIERIFDRIEALTLAEAQLKKDSIVHSEYYRAELQFLEQQIAEAKDLKRMYDEALTKYRYKEEELSSKLSLANENVQLIKLIESLRIDFGTVEPGIQRPKTPGYMEVYRKQENTLALAVALAKKNNQYEAYRSFFKHCAGMFNMVDNSID